MSVSNGRPYPRSAQVRGVRTRARRALAAADGTGAATDGQKAPSDIIGLRLRSKVWLEMEDRFVIGEGGWHLLRHIIRLGSLAAAARHIGWSYRHAWGYLRAAEGILGRSLTRPHPGKGTARGTELTSHGHALLNQLTAVRAEMDRTVGRTGVTAREVARREGRTSRRNRASERP